MELKSYGDIGCTFHRLHVFSYALLCCKTCGKDSRWKAHAKATVNLILSLNVLLFRADYLACCLPLRNSLWDELSLICLQMPLRSQRFDPAGEYLTLNHNTKRFLFSWKVESVVIHDLCITCLPQKYLRCLTDIKTTMNKNVWTLNRRYAIKTSFGASKT